MSVTSTTKVTVEPLTKTVLPAVPWQQRAEEKRTALASKIPSSWNIPSDQLANLTTPISFFADPTKLVKDGIFTEEELKITEQTAVPLLKELAAGTRTSVQVVSAFCKRAYYAQQLTSCLTETFFEEALARAEFLDQYLKENGKPLGPFHGLPISIKDSFGLKGQITTLGVVSYLDNPAESSNFPLIEVLLEAGAVLYCKTNVPQTLLSGDSDNNLFGRTINPYNKNCTPGGSSGGEGALMALKGSPLGVGTDVAGSIRIPSLCCGVYGFKPTAARIPYDSGDLDNGLPKVAAAAGPIARSVEDIDLFMKTVIEAEIWKLHPGVPAVRWREVPTKQKLRIGVVPEDPKFPLHPPVKRILTQAQGLLTAAGHELVPITLNKDTSFELAHYLLWQYLRLDPVDKAKIEIEASGQPWAASVSRTRELGHKLISQTPHEIFEIRKLNIQRDKFKYAWWEIFNSQNLDILLSPSAQNPAVPHATFTFPPYTAPFNVLDYPAYVIPFGKVSKELDPPFAIKEPLIGPDFDPVELDGLPCSIQLVARHNDDEELLRAVKVVKQVLGAAN